MSTEDEGIARISYLSLPLNTHTEDGQMIICPQCNRPGAAKTLKLDDFDREEAQSGARVRYWRCAHIVEVKDTALGAIRFYVDVCSERLTPGQSVPAGKGGTRA